MRIDAHEESWPLDKPFRIARGTRTEARVVVVTISDGQHSGRGEAVPLARYKQSAASVLAQIESMKSVPSLDRQQIEKLLPAGAARNALDCALWDVEAKASGKRVWELRTSRSFLPLKRLLRLVWIRRPQWRQQPKQMRMLPS